MPFNCEIVVYNMNIWIIYHICIIIIYVNMFIHVSYFKIEYNEFLNAYKHRFMICDAWLWLVPLYQIKLYILPRVAFTLCFC